MGTAEQSTVLACVALHCKGLPAAAVQQTGPAAGGHLAGARQVQGWEGQQPASQRVRLRLRVAACSKTLQQSWPGLTASIGMLGNKSHNL